MPEDPSPADSERDRTAAVSVRDLRLTETQRQILVALCRPCVGASRYTTPATNQQIAGEVYLSVDAVKAHLRALYRKFGVEPLPHNQKRARLVELVLEGGVVSPEQLGSDSGRGPADPPVAEPLDPMRRLRRRPLLLGAAALVGVAAALIAVTSALSGGSAEDSAAPPSKGDYVAAVNRSCDLALGQIARIGKRRLGAANAAERAGTYLGAIETVRGRLETLTPPAATSRALQRFRAGIRRAATFTGAVADVPPRPDTQRGANIVAELTFAAGQVQAGAVGYGLGASCSAVGDLVARSARNAAGAP
jgi:hypothetical protein